MVISFKPWGCFGVRTLCTSSFFTYSLVSGEQQALFCGDISSLCSLCRTFVHILSSILCVICESWSQTLEWVWGIWFDSSSQQPSAFPQLSHFTKLLWRKVYFDGRRLIYKLTIWTMSGDGWRRNYPAIYGVFDWEESTKLRRNMLAGTFFLRMLCYYGFWSLTACFWASSTFLGFLTYIQHACYKVVRPWQSAACKYFPGMHSCGFLSSVPWLRFFKPSGSILSLWPLQRGSYCFLGF